jgi:hypothetical protein
MAKVPCRLPVVALLIAGISGPASAGQSALAFTGGQILTIPSLPIGFHTVEAWIRPEGEIPLGTKAGTIFDWDGRIVLKNSLAGLNYSIDMGGAQPVDIAIPNLPAGEWHHVAASFDGNQMRLYLDGKPAQVKTIAGRVAGAAQGPAAFGTPVRAATGRAPFSGSLDDLRIWSVARYPLQVDEFLYDHLTGKEANLLAYWDLDEGTGQKAADLVAGRNGTLGDAATVDARDPRWSTAVPAIRKADAGFVLGFDPPGPLSLKSGELFDADCTLTTSVGATTGGVTAWSIAVQYDRTHLVVDDVTLVGTAAELHRSDGFAKLEILDDSSIAGFASQVVLSDAGGVALTPVGTYKMVRARFRGMLNYLSSVEAVIRYDDRIPEPTFGTAENAVTADGARKLPVEGRLPVSISSPRFALSFEPARAAVQPGREFVEKVDLTTEGNKLATGALAWSLSIVHDPRILEVVEIGTAGTYLEKFNPDQIFLINETIDNETGIGLISVAILNISGPRSLPPNGKEAIALLRYRTLASVPIGTKSTVRFVDGLQGSGVPISNQVTFMGGVGQPEFTDLPVLVTKTPFLRGNVNGDERLNLSDPIFLLNRLFFAGDLPHCDDAADANDDGRVNISDPIYLLAYLFQGGPKPPEPFPDLGDDPTADSLDCKAYP